MATYYIDPSTAINGDGSSGSPFNAWPSLASNNTYLQKRGTSASANLTAFGKTAITLGAYGSGAVPVVDGGSGIGLSSSGTSSLAIADMKLLSSGSYAVQHNGGNSFSATNIEAIGARAGLAVFSDAGAVAGVTLAAVTARNTVAVNENSGLFLQAKTNAMSSVSITDGTYSGSVGYGIQMVVGASNTLASIDGITIDGNQISDNGLTGLSITTGMTADSSAKVAQNVTITDNAVLRNGGPGIAVTLRAGTNYIGRNEVAYNNGAGLTGTGGLQMAGCKNTICEHNTAHDNYTAVGFDGVGIYLDVVSATLNDLGSSNCVVRRNTSYGNISYNPETFQGNPPSGGITVYHSDNCDIYSNYCHGNAAGVVLNAWCHDVRIFNNTFVDNDSGVVVAWNMASQNNEVFNNIVTGNVRGFWYADAGDRTTSGTLTLSGVGPGLVTATSSAADFAVYSSGYAIREVGGSGWGWVVAKTSSTEITINIVMPFASTTPTWALTYGQDQSGINNHNCLYGNSSDYSLAIGQTAAAGTGDVAQSPALVGGYKINPSSPCAGAGRMVDEAGLVDYAGKTPFAPRSIGCHEPARLASWISPSGILA